MEPFSVAGFPIVDGGGSGGGGMDGWVGGGVGGVRGMIAYMAQCC